MKSWPKVKLGKVIMCPYLDLFTLHRYSSSETAQTINHGDIAFKIMWPEFDI